MIVIIKMKKKKKTKKKEVKLSRAELKAIMVGAMAYATIKAIEKVIDEALK